MIKLTCSSVLEFFCSFLATPLVSQEVPVTNLSQPDTECERGFTKLVGVKELTDGRVILVDEIERLILLLDAQLAEGKPIGREGAGPGEYVVPSSLFPLGGDSSAVLDTPNRRLLVLTPEGEPGGVVNLVGGVGTLSASDDQGRFYSSWQGAVLVMDSSSLSGGYRGVLPRREKPQGQGGRWIHRHEAGGHQSFSGPTSVGRGSRRESRGCPSRPVPGGGVQFRWQ